MDQKTENLNADKMERNNNKNAEDDLAIPVIRIIEPNSTNQKQQQQLLQSDGRLSTGDGGFINPDYDSAYSIKDVNSTANLLGLADSSESELNYKINKTDVNMNQLRPLNKFNNVSQSSIETQSKFDMDADMIPLVVISNGKFILILIKSSGGLNYAD